MALEFVPIRERATVTVRVASEFSGVSRSRLYELMHHGDLESTTIQGRRLIRVPSLLKLVGDQNTSAQAA